MGKKFKKGREINLPLIILFFIHRGRGVSFLTLSYQTQTYTSLVGALQFDVQGESTVIFHV